MTPPIKAFEVAALPQRVQLGPDGRRRKTAGPAGADWRDIDLARDCELVSMLQYECSVTRPEILKSPVECWPVKRWYRRCQDLKGNFMAETTSWKSEEIWSQGRSASAAPATCKSVAGGKAE